ncbi:MAG: thymidine phosphorylase [Acidimicrobiales bacterium]
MATYDAESLIIAKRDGDALPLDGIRWFIERYTAGAIPEEQASALLMAIYFQGMDGEELAAWTQAMIDSGIRVDHSSLGRVTVDKHSTGGVGDKVSLILCPLVAACAPGKVAVPQLAGRALGHTGGTIDKMEAIPHWSPTLSADAMRTALLEVGAVIAAATGEIAPADKKLYALRDITGTVPSIPLIASSIMSKKIASGTEHLVLDVKVGRGAFMKTEADARLLAETMVDIGNRAGVATRALLTRMDRPLGWAVGNTIEVDESHEILRGEPNDSRSDDLREVTLALATEMLDLAGVGGSDPASILVSGQAWGTWHRMVEAQGGDAKAPRLRAAHERTLDAPRAGFVADLDALDVGIATMRLGAGRLTLDDEISLGAGVEILAKPGTEVEAGEPVLKLLTDDEDRYADALPLLERALTIGDEAPDLPPLVIDRIG